MPGQLNRRRFLRRAAAAIASGASLPVPLFGEKAGTRKPGPAEVRCLTRGPRQHFFGYYGICPWSGSGRHLLSLECRRQDRMPRPGETAGVGLVDADTGRFEPVAETTAWNLQQGAMLHWNPLQPDQEIYFNDLAEGELTAVNLSLRSGGRRLLPGPISGLSRDGGWALSLTYGRLGRLRRVVGYGAAKDPHPDDPAPADDGVFAMNPRTGERRLAVSIARVYEALLRDFPALAGRHMWFNHTVFNPSATRFLFLARAYLPPGRQRHTAMFTANRDGSDLRRVIDFDGAPSHFDWRNDREIIATFKLGEGGHRHVLFTDGARDYRMVGAGFLDFDGHCTFAPKGQRLATDRKLRTSLRQSLLTYRLDTDERRVLCTLPMFDRRNLSGDTRCDFHPRWSRDGRWLCIDAIEPVGRTRQLHLVRAG